MNLQPLRLLLGIFALVLLPGLVAAQCLWRLDMLDSYGDGWNGGQLTITSGTTSATYTLDNFNDDGIDSTLYFSVFPNEPLTFTWLGGAFIAECSFKVFDVENNLIYTGQNLPVSGELFATTGSCPPCVLPQNVQIENIYDKRVKLRWNPGIGTETATSWWVIYGPQGFTPGPGVGDTLVVTTPKATITGLTPKTAYSFYLIQQCGTEESSNIAGPFDFETYWSNDVGVTGVVTPQSSCDLGVETIRFQMTNFGANPQSLIPYNFFINGEPGGVVQPEDGYYTGVIGKDSTEVIEFETTYDFSEPGEYEITVIVQMEGDEDTSNDTLRYYINNVLVAPFAQSFENWTGGWTPSTEEFSFGQSSWAWGVPAAPVITAAGEGQKAWVTNLTGNYNQGENSFLTSTCFDFSALTTPPSLSFLLNTNLTEFNDFVWVESSVDGGTVWNRIGAAGEGLNWYNSEDFNVEPVWSGNTNGWVRAQHRVPGVAGQSNVLFRFAFQGGFFPVLEGVGIDDIRVLIPVAKDLATAAISTTGDTNECGLEEDEVTVTIANVGSQALPPTFQLAYSVNGGAPVIANITGNILTPDENFTYTFTVPFDSRDVVSVIQCWPIISGDQDLSNDTLTYVVSHVPRPVPFTENFEASTNIPNGWNVSVTGFSQPFVTNAHNNVSNVLAVNLYSGNPGCTYELPRYGVIGTGDSLSFAYRLTNWSLGTTPVVLDANTKIEVQVSTDCGQSYTTINTVNSLNHTPAVGLTTRKVSLDQFTGESVRIRFVGTWGAGDFWFDLDNVNVVACAADMGLTATVTNATVGQNDGSATVNVGLGNPPYQYLWDGGATTATLANLAIGSYTVTVTDSHGCTGVLEVSVGDVAVNDPLPGLTQLALRPNPTTGLLQLDLTFDQAVNDLRADVVNLLGQPIWTATPGRAAGLSANIDLSAQPAGIYLLRVLADGQVVTRKVVKQ